MVWQRLRIALLVGAFAAVASSARAGDCCAPAPCTQTVTCTEWVPEQYQATRTVYRTECKQEAYTAYRCECVPETRTCTRTVMKPVQETQTVMRTVCEMVPTVENRTVMQQFCSYKQVTTVCRKCVDRGHWECREVPCEPSFAEKFRKCFKKKNDCCCEPCCVKTKTVKCWVPCKVWVEVPVTTCQKVVECRPVTCQVTVCKRVERQVAEKVTCCKYVATQETSNYTVMTTRKVPYQATRTVNVCVPVQENYTCTRMVARQVQKEVPATVCCKPACCESSCCESKKKCAGLSFRRKKSCCD